MPTRLHVPAGLPEEAKEILSVWQTTEGQVIVIPDAVWEDPGTWGLLVAEIARHAASTYGTVKGVGEADALERILDLMETDLYEPEEDLEDDEGDEDESDENPSEASG